MSIEAMTQALEALENNRRTHYYCEDTWYSCPKHEDRCANDSEGDECNCGADKANVEIDAAITSLSQAIREHALREVQRLGQEIEQEPVAWSGGYPELRPRKHHDTHPPQRPRVVFPTMLRKMWSGGEVQAWLDENVNKEKSNG